MHNGLRKLVDGYQRFRARYAAGEDSHMTQLSVQGQSPSCMIVACSDSRVDPSIILQCDPGDLFVVRNVANLIPPYEHNSGHHGVSAALEFGVRYLNVQHLIILGHSQCAGIAARWQGDLVGDTDFISDWVSLIDTPPHPGEHPDDYAKKALECSRTNCLSFPWIKERVLANTLTLHTWFFDIHQAQLFTKHHGVWTELASET